MALVVRRRPGVSHGRSSCRLVEDVRTFEPMLSPGPLSWEPLAAPASRRWLRWFVPLFIVVALLAAANWPVPYFILAPGSARQVDDLIHLPKGKAYPPKGRVLLATVSLISDVRLIDLVRDRFDDNTQSIPEKAILGDQSKDQLRQANLQMMDNSKQIAVVVALRRLGHTVTEHGDGALVEQIVTQLSGDGTEVPVNEAAALQLRAGDMIVAADGTPTPLLEDAKAAIGRHRPGDVIRLDLVGADGSRRVENVPLVQRPNGTDAILGVQLQTKRPAVRSAVPDRHRFTGHRRPVGRPGLHTRSHRRADAGRADRRQGRGRHRRDPPGRFGRRRGRRHREDGGGARPARRCSSSRTVSTRKPRRTRGRT